MPTKLRYLDDVQLHQIKAKLLRVESTDQGQFYVFDRTIFYPQGGGQRCDIGTISNNEGQIFDITYTGFHDGEVHHFGNFDQHLPEPESEWKLKIDPETRLLNSKGHTAGHLVHLVMEELETNLRATKGHHFPKDAYIRFEGITDTDRVELIEKANENLKKYISGGMPVTSRILTLDQLKSKVPNIPFDLPEDKPLRTITIGDYPPVPCGGTHIDDISQLKTTTITKIKQKKGNTVVAYTFS
ncbi:hypothetical protein KJ966_27645 [bacterium]|nr:hypothetical protein [bacterium]